MAAAGAGPTWLPSCLLMSGSKVLEGFGRMLVLAVGPNSQQGIIHNLVMSGGTAAVPAAGQASGSGSSNSSSDASELPMLREATPLTSRLEDVANSIGGVGLAAAVAVLAVNSGLYTAELLASGGSGSPWTSSSLEVSSRDRRAGPGPLHWQQGKTLGTLSRGSGRENGTEASSACELLLEFCGQLLGAR